MNWYSDQCRHTEEGFERDDTVERPMKKAKRQDRWFHVFVTFVRPKALIIMDLIQKTARRAVKN